MKLLDRLRLTIVPMSPPSRGAWIEMLVLPDAYRLRVWVAPLAGGVD